MPDNILKYIFRDKSGAKHTVWKSDYDADPRGFAKAYPDARFEVVNRKTGDRGHVSVNDVGAAQKEGFNLFTMKAYQKEHYEKPKTIKQRAQEVAAQYQKGKQTKQPVDYLHRPQSQMGRLQRNVPAKASSFVRSLYEIDNAQKGPDYSVDYTSPKATQQVYQQNQHVRRQAAQTASDHIANDEYRRQSQPMIDNGTVGVMKPMGEIEQEMSDSASRFVDANLGDYINNAVLGEQNAAGKRAIDAYNNSFAAGGGGGGGINDLLMRSLAYNEENDPDKMIENLANNARGGLEKLFQNPSFVAKVKNEADMLGVTPEAYVESMLPHLKDRLSAALEKSEYNKYLPKDAFENMTNRFIDSNTIGKLVRGATMTRGQRIMQERASAATAAGENPYYKGSTVENVVADVAGMVSDPVFKGAAGAGGKVAGKLIGNSTKLSALMANGNLAQRLMAKGAQVVTSGGVTGFVFDSTGSVIQNYSTGEDTSLGNTLKVAAKGGTTGAVNFATMSLAGIPLSEVGRSIGLKAVKGGSFWGNTGRATAKIGLESGKTYMEAMGMYLGGYVSGKLEGRTDANGKPIEFDLWNGTMESLPTAIGFRLQHAVEGLRGGRKNEKGEDIGWFGSTIANFKDFVTSDKAKESRFLMTEDERNQIFSSGAMNGLMPDGENIVSYAKRTKNKKVSYDDPYLETDASMIKNTYDQIMADPKVSWDSKAKFSAMVTGIMPSARPMMDYITYSSEDYVKDGLLRGKRKYVNEYSAKGELLSKIPYDNKVDRDNVVYKHNIVRENQRLYNAMGLLARQDRNNYELQNDFFVENMKKLGPDVNSMVTNMGNEGSDVFRDFSFFALNSEKGTVLKTIDSVAVRNGMKSEDLIKAMKKNPMKRSDFEQNVCVELRRALEAKAFPDGKVHAEQSNLNGKDIAEDNSLGTEQPNGDAVKQELNGLRQAEAEMDALIRDNDIFSQNFKKLQSQGLTNPQIYDWMVQQGGLTVEQLEPFAHYINANARVQGMQEATKQKIEETVSVFAQDWSYHGTLNGQAMNGDQALYVQDSNGRTLLVGSGDVSFDQTTGRAKEGSGDMLVCFDPNTREMVYVKADEVTLLQNQPIDQFAAEYRQRLQMKNSEPYNQAAQEQAMLDAAKPQPKDQEAQQDNTTKSEDNTTNSGDLTKDDTTLTKVDTTSGKDNTTNEDNLHGKDSDIIREFDTKRGKHVVVRKVYSENDKLKVTKIEAKADDGTVVSSVHEYFPLPDEYEILPIDIETMEEGGTKVLGVNELRENKRGTYADGTALTDAGAKVVVKFEDGSIGSLDVGLIRKNEKPAEQPHPSRKFADGTEVPMSTDSKGRPTPDYASMTPEQSAEILTEDFGDNAEKVVDGQIQKAEKALKDAEKMKVDYTAEPNDIMEQEALKKKTVEAAKKQLDHAQNIKKAMTAKKVAETVGKTEQTEGAHEAGSVAAQKFVNAPRLVGNKRTRMLPDGETKIKGHYEIVPAEGLTPSHDVNNGYKKSEGFPTDAEGRTVNDRDYEHDKAAQQNTDQIARKYNGMAIEQVPVVSDEGIVYDGNGRTMAGQKAAKDGTDGEYINDLLENAENFGFTREQIEQSGIEHPRLVLVTDERLPYDTATFAKFNRNEKKTQSNTEQAVAKAKTLTSDEVGAIVAEIEGNGSLEAFFNNSKAINDLVKTLVDKGIIGQNEVAQMMDSPERLSAQGREYVKNLLLGSIFKPETIRMLGIDSTVKNKAINAIRSVMDNMKLGEFSLRDEIDQAIQLLYEARQGGNKVDTLLRTPSMFGEDAAKRYPSISQMMALALEGKVADFRDLLDEYNRIAAARNTGEGNVFGEVPTKPELIKEFLDFKKWQDYGTGHSENERGNDVSGVEEPQQEASGGNEPAEAERPRVEEADDLENKELESRIEVTDEETETPSKNGPIMKQKILIDGDKEVIKVDEPNDKGEYTGSYYEYDGKKFGDLNEVTKYIDSKNEEGPLPLLPKKENPDPTFNPIEAAAAEFKKEHPLTEEEIMKADVDDLSKDMALDYLNGEVTDDLHRAIYESIYAKRKGLKVEPKVETPKAEPSADPMEGIKNAAEGFEKEKKGKAEQQKKPQQTADDAAVAASNKKVNDLWKELKNAGKDEISASFIGLNSKQLEVLPKLVSAMAENAYLRIKRGMHNLEDVVKEMRKEFAPAVKVFKKEDVDAIYEQMMNIRYRDGEQRMSLKEWADYYEKTSPKHQENLVGDSKDAEERKQKENSFINRIQTVLSMGEFKTGIAGMRKIAENCGLEGVKDTDLQELVETAVVGMARRYATSKAMSDDVKFAKIKLLYNRQPSLNQRDSERVMKQQYSTPAPYAYLADMYVKGKGKVIESALEPSAGNGMLTIGLPMDKVHVNDIDAQRLANLRRQGFKNVTSQDGTQPFADKDVDVVVTNPPFGSATPKEYDGYKISSLEGQMAINALDSMKDDGRAAIIIGGKTEYAKNGSLNPKDKAFLGYLYSHYNVEDVINVDGSLFAKQGTTFPTRIILINGRRLNENAFPPVKDKARAETVKDYDELYKRIEDDILRGERMDSSIGGETRSAQPELDKQGSAGTPKERVRTRERGGSKPDGEREPDLFDSTSVSGTHDDLENRRGTKSGKDGGLSDGDTGANGARTNVARIDGAGNNSNPEGRVLESRGNGQSNTQLHDNESSVSGSGGGSRRQLQRLDQPVRGLSTEKVTYAPKSENPFTLKAVMPADQQEAVNKNLEKLGDADQFLVDELGYNDKDDLYSHLAAEQVDSVALALQQAKKGNAFIIGDQTGIGKGRQAASFVRYAIKNGQIPVYFTKTPELLSDVYRDLKDVGSPDLRPFILGDKTRANVTDSEGNIVYKVPSDKERDLVLDYIEKNGKLPDGYDYILTTYSQVGNGVYEFDENGARKERKLAKGKTFRSAALSGQKRRDAIEKLMGNAYLILDESHTAGGNSGQGNYFQHIIQKAKNVTFFSATFAKRPDNMPIYALRTAMNEGGMKSSDLIDAVKRGGATLQEIMSQTLTQCGQMIRRERDMTGVTIDWKAIDDPERVQEQREQYDSIIGLFNDIINFQKKYVSSYVDERNDELAAIQSTMGIKKGTAALGIKNQPFASKAFNTVQQVLLSLKAKSAAERAIDYLKQGMKPVIALSNTNESQTNKIKLGEEMDAPDLGTSLKKGLEGTLRYTQKDAKDNSESGYIKLEDLGNEAVEAYHELEKKIEQTSTGLSLSPIDVIKNELQKAGYKVGELTGRQTEFVYNDNGTVTKVKRADTDKKKLARDFNDGKIDALILNKSAATGISLHASSKYKDQKKRVMIVAQQQLDVNDEVQMRGRIDRTGQVARGAYEYVVSLIPAEQRLLMMFKAKLKSLDANTTSSQKSKFNEMEVADITNKYGDKVVKEYMAEHLDIYARMADPFGWEKTYGDDLGSINPQNLVASGGGVGDGEAGADASKLLGRMALLRVNEQEKMLKEIGELYANEIQRLNEMGENDLEITELPLKAKTLHKEVWKKGADPGGDNAFADNTYIEKVNMAILKKPMKASEVKASQKGLTGGKTWDEYKTEKKSAVKEYFDQKIADETQRYEERAVKAATKAKEKYIKDGKKGQEKSGMTDEQIEKNAEYQYDTIYKQEKDKLDDVVKNLKEKAGMFDRVLDTFDTDQAFVLPTDMNNPNELSGFGNSYGRLIDIKITDNFSPNASSVSFATLDGRRKITFPIAGKVGSGENKADIIGAIDNMTKQASGMGDSHLRVLNQKFDNWDRLTSNESRKNGYIVTGNLMQALVDSKDQGLGGQLVKYTTDTGEVKTGILMPDRFDPKGLTTDAPINSVADKFELSSWHGGIDEVTSSDGEVNVKRIDNYRGNFYELRVPKSKAKGGKYFMDEDLLKLVNGNNFETRGNNMLAEFKPDQLKPVLDRLSKMGVKVQEERKTSEDEGTHFREDRGDGNYPASSVESHVEKVAKKTGAKVNMVSSFDEITNKAAKAAVEEDRKITGWYDEKTGEVHLYMPNIHDRYTAEKTIWHEVVGHKGMRELFGEDRFNQFLRDVWYDLDKPENAELKKLVDEERKFNPLNIYDAIEEGIARLAEDGKGEPGFWNGIKNKVSDFLHEIGYRIAPNTKDVKYLLWLSKNLQKNPNDPYWKLRAEAVKYRLDHDRVPAVVERNGMFYGNDGKVRSMESMTKSEWNDATDGQIHFRTTPSAGTALDRYHRSLDEHGYMFTESYMDSMLSLKKLMNAIVPDKKIEDIASSENPYMLQNTMQGSMSDAAQMFERNVMKPLDKAMAGVIDAFDGKKDDEKIRNFNLYMITKHGLERNRVFFVRDFLRQMRMDEKKKQDADILENRWGNEKERLDNELNAGNIDLKEYYRQMDEFISNEIDPDYKAGEHDYSGIHAIQEVAKSSDPYDDAEAIQSVMDSEAKMESIKKGSVKDYWNKVKAATQYSIDSDYKNNIIDKESHDYVSNMFNWYVPLRKYDEATAEDVYGYITEVGDPKTYIGSTIMRARGHKYLSETNVLAQIGAMGNRAIKNGGLNAIKMAFARFARNNSNNNLITEVSVWYEKDPMTGIVYERYPDIPEDATPDEINQIVADFNTDMKAKAAQGLASKVYRRGSIGYKFQRAENKSQHIVDVKIAGRTHSFIINGNPRAAQALNGLLEHKNDTLAGRVAASISRNMAQLCTSYNPEFVMRNMIKDFENASINLLAKEGLVYTKRFEQYYAKVGIIEGIRNSKLKDFADTGGFGLFAKYRNGTLDTNDKVQRYFKEFMENGGETGWVQIKNMKDWTKEYKLHVKGERNKVQKVGKGFYNAIFKNLENINEIAENLARFSTYCASRDYGRSVIRSVYDAKEVSTNFNRHGSGNAIYSFKNGEMGTGKTARKNIYGFWAAWFRNSSMFFNAGIQSTNLLIKNFKNNKAGTIGYIASAPFISGMAMALLNNFIISNEDEKDRKGVKDPYGELPDYIRRNNLCVYIGGGEFVTIPLAIEERAFYGLGDLAAGMTFSKNISSQKMPNLTENKDIDKYLNPFMDAVGCMSQLVPVADYLGNASFGKHPWQETIKALAPSATSPFLEWVYNSDWKGAPIQRDNKFDENQPSWMLAYKGTPEWMINMNKKVNALTNDVAPGNEDMKGNDFLDAVTNPSAFHHFYGSYFGGAATFVERVGGLIKNGKDTETKDIPFLRSLLYTPSEQSSLQRTKSKWYNYKDEMEKTMANVDRLKSKNVPIDKRITNIGEYYHFQNSKEAAKVRVIELAEKQMDRWKKMRDKASDTESINFANQNIDRIMMDAVDDLDKLN